MVFNIDNNNKKKHFWSKSAY